MSIDTDIEKKTAPVIVNDKSLDTEIRNNNNKQYFFAVMILTFISLVLIFGGFIYIDKNSSKATTIDFAVVGLELLFGVACGLYAVKIVLASSEEAKVIIHKDDRSILEEIIRNGDEKGMNQYIKLASLSGVTGTFTKLGLTGLPLATIGLTIFFSAISLLRHDLTDFMDLAKLTLGAFIGSFVQRNVSTERFSGESNNHLNNKT